MVEGITKVIGEHRYSKSSITIIISEEPKENWASAENCIQKHAWNPSPPHEITLQS